MLTVTLTTDYGYVDPYVASIKGKILSYVPAAQIIDISHSVPSFNIYEAAYLVIHSFSLFPKNTIHIVNVNASDQQKNDYILAIYQEHYFIAPDNGVLSLIFGDNSYESYRLQPTISTFPLLPLLDLIGPFLMDIKPSKVGIKSDLSVHKAHNQPTISGNTLKGVVLHVDTYGNLITNLSKDLFHQYTITNLDVMLRRNSIYIISDQYSDVEEGEKLCLFNSNNLLEIAINKGNANKLLGLKQGDIIQVIFS